MFSRFYMGYERLCILYVLGYQQLLAIQGQPQTYSALPNPEMFGASFSPRCTPLSWIKAYQSHTPNSSLFEEDVFCSKTWVTWVTWVISIQCRKTPACSNIPGTGGHHLPMAMAWSNPCRKAGTIISVQIESDKKESKK